MSTIDDCVSEYEFDSDYVNYPSDDFPISHKIRQNAVDIIYNYLCPENKTKYREFLKYHNSKFPNYQILHYTMGYDHDEIMKAELSELCKDLIDIESEKYNDNVCLFLNYICDNESDAHAEPCFVCYKDVYDQERDEGFCDFFDFDYYETTDIIADAIVEKGIYVDTKNTKDSIEQRLEHLRKNIKRYVFVFCESCSKDFVECIKCREFMNVVYEPDEGFRCYKMHPDLISHDTCPICVKRSSFIKVKRLIYKLNIPDDILSIINDFCDLDRMISLHPEIN